MGHHSNGRLLTSPANIRERWKYMALTNSPAYCNGAKIMAVKNYSTGPGVNYVFNS
jgi:hypothetical protein